MRTTRFIMPAVLLSWVLGLQGAWAGTAGYVDSGFNSVTGRGVVGAKYTSYGYGAAIDGWASSSSGPLMTSSSMPTVEEKNPGDQNSFRQYTFHEATSIQDFQPSAGTLSPTG